MVQVTWFKLFNGSGLNGTHTLVLQASWAPFVQSSLSANQLGLDSKAFFFDASYCWLSQQILPLLLSEGASSVFGLWCPFSSPWECDMSEFFLERNALKMFLYFQSTLLKYITCILLVIAIIYKINVSVEFSNKTNDYLYKISNSFL